MERNQGRIQDFSWGAQPSFDPRGVAWVHNGLKLPENCTILKKILGAGGQGARASWIRSWKEEKFDKTEVQFPQKENGSFVSMGSLTQNHGSVSGQLLSNGMFL